MLDEAAPEEGHQDNTEREAVRDGDHRHAALEACEHEVVIEDRLEAFRMSKISAVLTVERSEQGIRAFERLRVDPVKQRDRTDRQEAGKGVQLLDRLVIDEQEREDRDLNGHEELPKEVHLPTHVHDGVDKRLLLNWHAPPRDANETQIIYVLGSVAHAQAAAAQVATLRLELP